MGADGSRGPKPYTQRRVSTLFLRVPAGDWPAVKRGYKSEFRAGAHATGPFWNVEPPTPVVAYAVRQGVHDAQLMVLEEHWTEPLGAMSPESLEREGFKSLAEFRTYWMAREHKRFRPLRQVHVYRLRTWQPEDAESFAEKMLGHLYGEWLPVLA